MIIIKLDIKFFLYIIIYIHIPDAGDTSSVMEAPLAGHGQPQDL